MSLRILYFFKKVKCFLSEIREKMCLYVNIHACICMDVWGWMCVCERESGGWVGNKTISLVELSSKKP